MMTLPIRDKVKNYFLVIYLQVRKGVDSIQQVCLMLGMMQRLK